jgi:hypothetical protein
VHRGESARTRSTEQPQKERLGLIVACVPDSNHICVEVRAGPLEKRMPGRVRRVLERPPFALGPEPYILALNQNRHVHRLGQRDAESLIPIGA